MCVCVCVCFVSGWDLFNKKITMHTMIKCNESIIIIQNRIHQVGQS